MKLFLINVNFNVREILGDYHQFGEQKKKVLEMFAHPRLRPSSRTRHLLNIVEIESDIFVKHLLDATYQLLSQGNA